MRALDRYQAVLTLPGARGPVAASILGSLPIGMFGLAILLLARDATGSFALAGRVAGAFGLANAIGAVAAGAADGPARAAARAAAGGGRAPRGAWARWWRWPRRTPRSA